MEIFKNREKAFLDWIKAGKAFIGMHSATDTFRGYTPLDPYVEMLGAEFKTHHDQAEVDCINEDPNHPACRDLDSTFHVKDEIYLMNGFERSNVHPLLMLDKHPNDKTPGDYPIAWCKMYGKGRVFYTSLGHREDVWDPNTPANFKRENPKEVSELYPTVGVLLTTGYSDVAAAAETRFPILRKPFEVAALERAVSRALARGQRSDVKGQRSDVRGQK